MTRKRFKELIGGSFLGDHMYEPTVPTRQFLRRLEKVVDCDVFAPKLVRLCRGEAKRGRPPYDQAVILEMPMLSCFSPGAASMAVCD